MTVTKTRFVADVMLGRLAKWLRILGYDTLYSSSIGKDKLIEAALGEGRLLLTRRAELKNTRGIPSVVCVETNNVEEQLKQVIRECDLNIDPRSILSLCLKCNHPLEELSKEVAEGLVPDHVLHTTERFSRCPVCREIYWKGSHVSRMIRKVETLLS
jgi:uncharacterized protein with PIN domain